MSSSAIQVRNLSKAYRLGRKEEVPDSLVGAFTGMIRAPWDNWRRLRRLNTFQLASALESPDVGNTVGLANRARQIPSEPDSDSDVLWALRDVSFEIKTGDVVGIIGGNGAGKSTLLKILSRITEPTSGRAVMRGRISSLLEVGTGFHPDLTGRENIYMNGTILGMSKREVDSKFDEIVAFSGVEKFLDTPVKRYSSGMLVRLAFSVAAHLEPEVLIIDEVLAVGDGLFQKKCLGRIEEIAGQGRTVLFVSHNMQAVQHLCTRAVLLRQGMLIAEGPVREVLDTYSKGVRDDNFNAETAIENSRFRRGSGAVRFEGVRIQDATGNDRLDFKLGQTIRFALKYRVYQPVSIVHVLIQLRSGLAGEVVTSIRHPVHAEPVHEGLTGEIVIELPEANLRPNEYSLYLWLGDDSRQNYDTLDGLIGPLHIFANGSAQELGFDPTVPSGYFSIASTITGYKQSSNR